MTQMKGKWIVDETIGLAKINGTVGESGQVIKLDGSKDAQFATLAHTDISDFDTGVQQNRLDQMANPTAAVAMNSQKITGLANGTDNGDAVNKSQLDAAISGLTWKEPALDYITNNTVAPPTEESGDRYVLSDDGGAPHEDWDGASAGDIVDFNGSTWDAVTPTGNEAIFFDDDDSAMTFDNDTSAWIQFSGAGQVVGGAGLTKSGNTLNVGAGTGITVNADDVQINLDSDITITGEWQLNDLRVNEATKVSATSTELNILDGVTATTAEINYLDNDDLTSADLQKLADLTASATELNLNDGIASVSTGTGDNDKFVTQGYVDDAVAAVDSRRVETITLDGTMITNKSLTLAATPADVAEVVADVAGAPKSVYTDDYTVSGTTLTWDSLGWDGIVEAGDKVVVSYHV